MGRTPNKQQVTIFQTPLINFINLDHELALLAQYNDWEEVENEFKGYFSENGCPSVPIRKMVGLMLLKSLYNLSDENTVARWVENPYYQYLQVNLFSRLNSRLPRQISLSFVAVSGRKESRSCSS